MADEQRHHGGADPTDPDKASPSDAAPKSVHRTGGPSVDPDIARSEEPGASGNGNGDRAHEPERVPLDGHGEPASEPDRLAAPVGDEQPPRLPLIVVGVGASAGGLEAFTEFLLATPPNTGMAFVLIVHLPPDRNSLMAEVLAKRTRMPVRQIEDGMAVEPDHVYVIRPGHTLTIGNGRLHLTVPLETRGHTRPVDDFFRSLAAEQRERAVAVVLSGMGSNGTAGAQAIKAVGGICLAQDPESALYPSMPRHLLDQGNADYVLPPGDMPAALLQFAGHPYARAPDDPSVRIAREQQEFADILAILRTRTRQDFSGYKRATLFRRVQRRMGLNQVTQLIDYVRLLRGNPAEVQSLADDLLIHVTGFFRDPPAWETLRQRIIDPLVAERTADQSIRCWVTACSSGEEAYTLAILIAEAMEQANKRIEVKVFATDMADRSLVNARAGTFALGIESEVTPERLERFFDKDDAVYRVKKHVRDMVVFAAQNALHDPPFSRLDICTCRNLLIYLEPELQRRLLAMIHFGLREGGALLLGTSETVGGVEDDQFEPIDKKWRIYRRVGRHGHFDFPLPRPLNPARSAAAAAAAGLVDRVGAPLARGVPQRMTVAQLTERTLLHRYAPAAVVVDREGRVVYYHGPTGSFLAQPAGEPTRDLLALCREGLRAAVRAALTAATAGAGVGHARDGMIETADHGPRRVWVSVAPLDVRPGHPSDGHLLVTFEEREEPAVAALPPGFSGAADEVLRLGDELAHARDELHGTIEELQSSNEELKAANEEVTSINEELQSSNEELETSKEELQSLNEELTTVNAQLQAKNDELQATGNDLSSLLASTDIAVIFLDPRLRIRRFTPAVRDLLGLISSDVGRPLSDLHRKFEDPKLLDDARAVLERLVPLEAEVRAPASARVPERWYQRRVTPYRTSDDRIDGIVITFVDVTDRKRVELELAEAREYAESIVQTLHEPLLVLNSDLTVRSANPAFFRDFRVMPASTIGRKIYDLGNGQWNIPSLREALERVLPADHAFKDYEVSHTFDDIGRRVMLLNGRRLDHVDLILLGIRDVTEERAARASEDSLREREQGEEQFRQVVEGVSDFAMIELGTDNRITSWNAGAKRITGYTRAEAVGQPVAMIFTPEDRAAGAPERELAEASRAGRAQDERWHLRKDGSRFWASGVLTMLPGPAGGPPRGFVKIMRDETARKLAEETLSDAKQAAEEASRVKDDFLAMLSHELRTPLGAMLLWAKLLRSGSVTDAQRTEGHEAIVRSAEAQKQLIEDLLDMSRMTAGRLRLERREVELASVVRSAADSIRPAIEAKRLRLDLSFDPNVGVVRVDPDRMQQVMWNLISNAVKFTPEGGRVSVSVRRLDARVEIRVADTGAGIGAEFLPHVFERFRQAEAYATRRSGGLGLGLSITRQLVELHGGTITAESPGENQGATFTVRLPLPKVQRGRRSGGGATPGAGGAAPAGGEGAEGTTPPLDGASVMVVEDDPETRNVLSVVLRGAGATVSAVESVAAALDAFARSRPDVIVSDIGLAGGNGFELIRRIRQLEATASATPVPAVALTAYTRDRDIRLALDSGFQQHVSKPVEPDRLVSVLRSLLGQ